MLLNIILYVKAQSSTDDFFAIFSIIFRNYKPFRKVTLSPIKWMKMILKWNICLLKYEFNTLQKFRKQLCSLYLEPFAILSRDNLHNWRNRWPPRSLQPLSHFNTVNVWLQFWKRIRGGVDFQQRYGNEVYLPLKYKLISSLLRIKIRVFQIKRQGNFLLGHRISDEE